MRYLAIDLGSKRTGLALGDDHTGLVSPLEVLAISSGDQLLEAVLKAVQQQRPDALIVGMPLNMDGSEGPAAAAARNFARQVAQRAGLPAHLQDERLSSYAAEQHINRSGRTHKQKKALRDALAAAEILRDFLEARGRRQ